MFWNRKEKGKQKRFHKSFFFLLFRQLVKTNHNDSETGSATDVFFDILKFKNVNLHDDLEYYPIV